MTTTTEKKAPKVPTFYRTVTITGITATLESTVVSIEVGGDITTNQAIKRIKESAEYKAAFKEDQTPKISVEPRKEEREITIDDFLKYSMPRTKPEPKVEQVKADIPATK